MSIRKILIAAALMASSLAWAMALLVGGEPVLVGAASMPRVTRADAIAAFRERGLPEAALRDLLRAADAGEVVFAAVNFTADDETRVFVRLGTKPPVDGRGSGDRREAAEHENWSIDVPVTPQRPTRLVMPVPAGGGTMNLQIETGDAVYAHFANGTRPVVFVDTFEVWPRELSAGFGQSKSCCAGRRG